MTSHYALRFKRFNLTLISYIIIFCSVKIYVIFFFNSIIFNFNNSIIFYFNKISKFSNICLMLSSSYNKIHRKKNIYIRYILIFVRIISLIRSYGIYSNILARNRQQFCGLESESVEPRSCDPCRALDAGVLDARFWAKGMAWKP